MLLTGIYMSRWGLGEKTSSLSQSITQRGYYMKKCTYFTAVTFALLALVLLPMNGRAQILQSLTGDCSEIVVVDSFNFPFEAGPDGMTPTVHGLAFNRFDRSLWGAEYTSGKIHKFKINYYRDTIKVVKTIPASNDWPTGITFQGNKLWCASAGPGVAEICKLRKWTGRIIGCFPDLGRDSTGLTFAEGFLWNAGFVGPPEDEVPGFLYKLNTSGDLIAWFPSPGSGPEGLAYDGEYLWHVDWYLNKIYKIDLSGNVLCSWGGPGRCPIGLTFDGCYLWLADQCERMIYKLDIDHLDCEEDEGDDDDDDDDD
jgi:hypothetical protein